MNDGHPVPLTVKPPTKGKISIGTAYRSKALLV